MSLKPKKGLRLRTRWRATNGYFRFGLSATVAVVVVIGILSLGPDAAADMPRWKAFWFASPNEIGDTIAGVAGTLAFLWIIVTVMIQGSELRLQRRELAMTRRELKAQREASEKMAIAQDAQVRALEAQASIFEDEKAQRDESRAKEALDGHLKNIRSFLQHRFLLEETWLYFMAPGREADRYRLTLFSTTDRRKEAAGLQEVDFFQMAAKRIRAMVASIDQWDSEGRLASRPSRDILDSFFDDLDSISGLTSALSIGQLQRLHALGIENLRQCMEELAGRASKEPLEATP